MNADQILGILDRCCDDDSFPMLDNGYVHLAATRLSLYRSPPSREQTAYRTAPEDWAMVIEVFGFSPRAGLPHTQICTFGSRLHARESAEHPHDESHFVYPIEPGDWQGAEDWEGEENSELVSQELARGRAAIASVSELQWL